MKSQYGICLMLMLSFGCLAMAQENQPTDIRDVSLEDLLNTNVEVAGKTRQKISEAPAIVSVITAADIQRMGARDLYEVLSYVPGINVTEAFYGYTSVSFRGNLQTNYNNKSLVLINNHPMFETVVGSFYLEQIPIIMVKRIEIIRGPGSTLYGTNAFAGVIKIITKDGEDMKNEVQASAGSYGAASGGVAFGRKTEHYKFGVGVEGSRSDGYPYTVLKDEDGRSGTIDYRDNYVNGIFSGQYRDLTLNVGVSHDLKDKYGLVPTLVSTGERKLNSFFFDATYSRKVGERIGLSAQVYYDRLSKDEIVSWYPPVQSMQDQGVGEKERQEYAGYKKGAELQGSFALPHDFNVIAGFLYESQHTSPYMSYAAETGLISPFKTSPFLESYDAYDLSGYAQLDKRFFGKLGVVAGIRFNYNDTYGSKLVPRGGVVYSFTDRLSLKVLYGKAFRNPNFFEKYVNTVNVLDGDAKLMPEEISTLDVGVDCMLGRQHSLRVNYFYTSTDNLITRCKIVPAGERGNTKPTPQYGNAMGQKMQGLEMELKGLIHSGSNYFVNCSIVTGKEKATDTDVEFIPRAVFNLGLNWNIGKVIVSPYLQYVGEKKGTLLNLSRFSEPAYSLLNFNVSYEFNKNLELQFIGKNLLDKTYAYPEYIRRKVAETPGGPGISAYGKLVFTF